VTDPVLVFDTDVDVVVVPLPEDVLVGRGEVLVLPDFRRLFVFRGVAVYVTVRVK
jgi:hypothetical protein